MNIASQIVHWNLCSSLLCLLKCSWVENFLMQRLQLWECSFSMCWFNSSLVSNSWPHVGHLQVCLSLKWAENASLSTTMVEHNGQGMEWLDSMWSFSWISVFKETLHTVHLKLCFSSMCDSTWLWSLNLVLHQEHLMLCFSCMCSSSYPLQSSCCCKLCKYNGFG